MGIPYRIETYKSGVGKISKIRMHIIKYTGRQVYLKCMNAKQVMYYLINKNLNIDNTKNNWFIF